MNDRSMAPDVSIENFEVAVVLTEDQGSATVGKDGVFPPDIDIPRVVSPKAAMVASAFLAKIVLLSSDWTPEMVLHYLQKNLVEESVEEISEIIPEEFGEKL